MLCGRCGAGLLGGEDIAHEDLVDAVWLQPGAVHGSCVGASDGIELDGRHT